MYDYLFKNFLTHIERSGPGGTISVHHALRLVREIRRLLPIASGTWVVKDGQAYKAIADRYPEVGETVCNSNLEIFKYEIAFPSYRYPILSNPISLPHEAKQWARQ